jgi:chromosome segregation protein
MRIERIELNGFKSFSDKTVFNFHPGVTAVVGPNGCGKSNIVDALRWVLGEQSAKSLRGDRMEDVIFTGAATRKPKGMAEVTLVISGASNGNQTESGEISVTRRLYRSGESEYLMNKLSCRLKDIKNVFLDTGLELKTYSILEQGKIDIILNSKPHERRFLIEEVAGIMKYNVRKAEALQKLETSQSNLQRLQDIIAEVKRQINSIERFTKRAEKYKALFEEIKHIEVKIAVRNKELLSRELSDLTDSESTFKAKETELSTHIHSSDALIEKKKLSCTEKEKSLEEIQRIHNSAERGLIEEESRISLLKKDCENLKGRLQRLFNRDSELEIEKDGTITQMNEMQSKITEMKGELANIDEILDTKKETRLSLETELRSSEEKLDAERKNIFNKAEQFSAFKNEISNLSLIKENIEKKEIKNDEDINTVKDEISQRAVSKRETESKYHDVDTRLKDKYKQREEYSREISEKKEQLTVEEGHLYREREALAAMTSREESLKELDRSRKNVADDNIKILCQIADIFEPIPEYETAIEAALGDKLNVTVVDGTQEIKKALEFIKEHNRDRSGFVSARVSPLSHSPPFATDSSSGIIGKAIDFVKVREGFDNIAALLLNDVFIVENLNTAFELWQKFLFPSSKNSGSHYLVTVEGEVLEPSGIVFGGTEKNILKVKREIKELEKNRKNKKASLVSSEGRISTLKNTIASVEDNLTSLNNEISQLEKTHHELQLKIASLRDEDSRQQKKIEYLFIELEEDRKEKDNICRLLNEKSEHCNIFEKEKYSKEEEIREVQKEIEAQKTSLETMRSELTETMLSHTAIKEKRDSLLRENEKLNVVLRDIDRKKEEMSKERLEIESDIKNKEDEILKKEDSLKSFVLTITELQGESSKSKEILEAEAAGLSLLEKQQKVNIEELMSVRKDLAGVEIKKTELSLKLTHLKEDITKSYSIDLDSSTLENNFSDPLLPEEEEKLPGLKEKLQNIGPVNLGTLEELEELRTRYDFLKKQQEDLVQAITSLQDTISRINNTTRSKLTHAFESLNQKFKEVFAVLFGKGRAELILTEGSILDAGIEIVAQPPGKKLQNLMLLSGGEKALTAISLLFAGFMVKPTPLCLLDEVDAPLDESNTDRFTSLLTRLSKSIQFIAITHNRRTMEVSDYLYGVTMEEPGVSKVVSMHMAEMV